MAWEGIPGCFVFPILVGGCGEPFPTSQAEGGCVARPGQVGRQVGWQAGEQVSDLGRWRCVPSVTQQ